MLTCSLLLLLAGCGVHNIPSADLLALYTTPATAGTEWLWASQFSSDGHPLGTSQRLGVLGPVAQTELATRGPNFVTFITLGTKIISLSRTQRVRVVAPMPPGYYALSVRWWPSGLLAVVESDKASHVQIWRWKHGDWQVLRKSLPEGIVTLIDGPSAQPMALIVDPHRVYTVPVFSRSLQYPVLNGGSPQGTAGFAGLREVVPYATGARGFGQWTATPQTPRGSRQRFVSVQQAVLEMAPGSSLWGLTVHGMVPYHGTKPQWAHIRYWPAPMQTTMVVEGRGTPWLLILDGASQGIWFNVRSGNYGPQFAITMPYPDVVREVAIIAR
ncbi:MAG: hypothetical protein M1499_04460 [Firmicutes bacterium]|nr:hypothetical protein [Bacillota bacterium]